MAEKGKNPAAVVLGRLGGKKRAANLSAEDLSAQGKKAAAARWTKARPAEERVTGGAESPVSARPDPVIEANLEAATVPATKAVATAEGRDSNAMLALREQGYEVGEPATHPDGIMRVGVRSQDVSAWVTTGAELLDLAAGRVTLEGIVSRRHRSAAAAG